MPNRLLKESIKTSDQIDKLSWFEEVVFYRILVTVDDYGCMNGRPIIVKNELFPAKDNVKKSDVESALKKLSSIGLILIYESGGLPYIYLPTWEKHQRIRNKHRKFPEPPVLTNDNGLQTFDSKLLTNDGQMSADCLSESNPIQSNTESKRESESNSFEMFWCEYPRKVARSDALKAWNKLKPDYELVQTIITDVRNRKLSSEWMDKNGRFIPYPASYLNGRRWEDEQTEQADVLVRLTEKYEREESDDKERNGSDDFPYQDALS